MLRSLLFVPADCERKLERRLQAGIMARPDAYFGSGSAQALIPIWTESSH